MKYNWSFVQGLLASSAEYTGLRSHDRDLQTSGLGSIVMAPGCMADVYGGSLGCTANDVKIVSATDVVILDVSGIGCLQSLFRLLGLS